ncbi:Phage protein [Gammaproteobacteria bacterium]
MNIEQIDAERVALAIEADAGMALPGLRESLEQAKRGEFASITTPEQIKARRGRPIGSKKSANKVQTAIRFDEDVLSDLRATGKGWQTRVNEVMRDWLKSHSPT